MNIHQNNNIIINKMLWINLIWIFILYNNKTVLAFRKEERPTTTPNGNSLYKQELSTAADDTSISYITQPPIGNIVYETEVDNDADDDDDENDDGTDNAIITSGARTTSIAGGNSQNKYLNKHVNAVNRILSNHASKLNYPQHHHIYNNNKFEQKKQQRQQQQQQQQQQQKQQLQHQHVISSYTSAADKLKEKQMNRKNWDKTNKHHKSNIYRTQMKHNNKQKHKLKSTYRNGGNRAHDGGGFMQAHVNYFDKPMRTNNNYQYNKYQDKIIAQSKWPHIERVRQLHQLHQYIADDLPPYIKKYNRRNKQLLDLLEGTISPAALYDYQNYQQHHHHHHHHHHHNKHHSYKDHQRKEQQQRQQNSKWVEKNLFEIQRPAATATSTTVAISTISNLNNNNNNNHNNNNNNVSNQNPIISNELPDQHLHIPDTENSLIVSNTHNSTIYTISPKADKFVYHRIASPKLIGLGGTYGPGYKKQRLPFVAITDKRLAPAKKNLRNSSNEQNNLPMP